MYALEFRCLNVAIDDDDDGSLPLSMQLCSLPLSTPLAVSGNDSLPHLLHRRWLPLPPSSPTRLDLTRAIASTTVAASLHSPPEVDDTTIAVVVSTAAAANSPQRLATVGATASSSNESTLPSHILQILAERVAPALMLTVYPAFTTGDHFWSYAIYLFITDAVFVYIFFSCPSSPSDLSLHFLFSLTSSQSLFVKANYAIPGTSAQNLLESMWLRASSCELELLPTLVGFFPRHASFRFMIVISNSPLLLAYLSRFSSVYLAKPPIPKPLDPDRRRHDQEDHVKP
ncbi:hypothetical protein GALMADRAFT_216537 [Galerina marginata CBS 339.88]|uniref:Uncharacterized protein n=1 Tax=Galerina marginata (strain CBS 339.88) TaxID=685588 RepID=A0A067SB99_GALM3|nr:hypothetical protein GALMADRAFT_216537 [Galerina marginata CBS 339.88]